MIREFIHIFLLYRKAHSTRYALKVAWQIAVLKWSF